MIYEFAATQDLHGYNKPWAGGAYKNICEPVNDTPTYFNMTPEGVYTQKNPNSAPWATSWNVCLFHQVLPAGTYAITVYEDVISTVPSAACLVIREDLSTIATMVVYNKNRVTGTIVLAEETEIGLFAKIYNGAWKFQIEEGSTASDIWYPYVNVCMPEGFNIWDPTNQDFIQVYAGYVNSNTRELYLRPVYKEYAGEELVGPWMSSMDEYSEDATPTEGAFVIDFGGELESFEITPFMLQTLLDSLGIRQHFTNGAGLLNSLMDQAQGRVRSEEELLHLSRPLNVIAIGDQLPAGLTLKPISKDVLPGLPGKFIR